jgi:uncharacterized alpha-E superfamily protein
MISRVADSCFWLSRYLERADTLARMLEVNHSFQLDVSLPAGERWRPLVIVAGQEEDFLERIGEKAIDDGDAVEEYLTWDPEHPSSIFSSIHWARQNARTVRETMSVEMWETLNDTWLWLKSRSARRLYLNERDAFYERLCAQCMLFHGMCYSLMLHEEPFVFMKLGRAVERAGQTARILDVQHHSLGDAPREEENAADAALWLAILRSCSAFDPFFKRAARVLSGPAVAEFLIFDATFPRSVRHNLDATRGLLLKLRESDPPGMRRRSWDKLERFRGELDQMRINDVQHLGVHEVLTWIVQSTHELAQAIHDDYLDPPLDVLIRATRALSSQTQTSQTQAQTRDTASQQQTGS